MMKFRLGLHQEYNIRNENEMKPLYKRRENTKRPLKTLFGNSNLFSVSHSNHHHCPHYHSQVYSTIVLLHQVA